MTGRYHEPRDNDIATSLSEQYLVAALPVPVGADGGVVQVLEGEGGACARLKPGPRICN